MILYDSHNKSYMKRKDFNDIELLLSQLDKRQLCDFIREECVEIV